jgi:hypothetical protein
MNEKTTNGASDEDLHRTESVEMFPVDEQKVLETPLVEAPPTDQTTSETPRREKVIKAAYLGLAFCLLFVAYNLTQVMAGPSFLLSLPGLSFSLLSAFL